MAVRSALKRMPVQDFDSFYVMFSYIGDLFCPVRFLDFRTVCYEWHIQEFVFILVRPSLFTNFVHMYRNVSTTCRCNIFVTGDSPSIKVFTIMESVIKQTS